MKAIMISDHAKWCAKMMNGEKKIEVRKGNVGKAVQKLIDEYGYANIYVYCSKDKKNLLHKNCADIYWVEDKDFQNKNKKYGIESQPILNGKVLFKFRCYKVEEIKDVYNQENEFGGLCESYGTETLKTNSLLDKAQLDYLELADYLNDYTPFGYAIHISDLEIFDNPKELSEFYKGFRNKYYKREFGVDTYIDKYDVMVQPTKSGYEYTHKLTKAPQSMCYIEVE